MEPLSYLKALRRHWGVIVLSVVVAVGSAWALMATVLPPPPVAPSYTATKSFLYQYIAPDSAFAAPPGAVTNLSTVAALATLGEVPDRVLALVHDRNSTPPEIADQLAGVSSLTFAEVVMAEAIPEKGLLQITASAGSPQAAEFLTNTVAEQLIGYLEDLQRGEIGKQEKFLNLQISGLRTAMVQATSTELPGLQAQLAQAKADIEILEGKTPTTGLVPTGDVDVHPAPATGFDPLRSFAGRLILAAVIGLMAGMALALILEHVDSRIRTRKQAESSFGSPVLAEIPPLGKRSSDSLVLVGDPRSPGAEAFRLVGAEVWRRLGAKGVRGQKRGASTVVVTSAGPNEGKSTLAANMSVALTESGHRVVLLSCDLRRPTLHQLFGVSNERGLTGVLTELGSPALNGHVQETDAGVALVPSGAPSERPGELLASERMMQVLREARSRYDIVVIDTSPILTVSDAAHLLPQADVVLLVVRAGRTTTESAGRTKEVVARLGEGDIGVVLNDTRERTRSQGYGNNYYAYLDKRRRGFPSLARHSRKR